jgi:hypothetical protein
MPPAGPVHASRRENQAPRSSLSAGQMGNFHA